MIHFVFSILIDNFHSWQNLESSFKQFWRPFADLEIMTISSAYTKQLIFVPLGKIIGSSLTLLSSCGKSLMYMLNRFGLRGHPCLKPFNTGKIGSKVINFYSIRAFLIKIYYYI